ncbi:hypothetical protein TOPH_02002 [Tolypocladium ophioglossoides CBS 100239]|uniref:Uncharacterized protein n=1 Tax=Tolypocladium ophioglossoides (strain CBS 100239) TaxID=1163406 RepID=A0A0L0NGQ4_TOLOC|nr:hypothetical protein TOPH_02002 [Tolypocladium ophioglossoides CBS 100239]
MSWKLTKELKETHLGPWSNFSRTPSTSSISEKDQEDKSESSTTAAEDARSSGKFRRVFIIWKIRLMFVAAVDGLTQPPVVKTRTPGILIVTLHEGRGFSLSSHIETCSRHTITPQARLEASPALPALKHHPPYSQATARCGLTRPVPASERHTPVMDACLAST